MKPGKTVCAAALAFFLGLAAPGLAAGEKKPPAGKAAAPSPPPAKAGAGAAKPASETPADAGAVPMFGGFSFTSKKEPIEINSEKLDFDYKQRRTVFRGDVEVVQGDVHLRTDTLTVDYQQVGDKQELREVTADGNVSIVQGPKKATGNHAVFDQSTRTMVLTGNAILEEGSNQVNGDKIVVHPDESRMEVLGQNRRVKVILFPGKGPLGTETPGAGRTPAPGAATAGPANSGAEGNGAERGS